MNGTAPATSKGDGGQGGTSCLHGAVACQWLSRIAATWAHRSASFVQQTSDARYGVTSGLSQLADTGSGLVLTAKVGCQYVRDVLFEPIVGLQEGCFNLDAPMSRGAVGES